MASSSPPLTGVRVLEFAGLAPGPYAGLLLADYGATVLRIDRAHPKAHTSDPPPATADSMTRHKRSITVDVKTPAGIALLKALIPHTDVLIDPFRPGVLEKLGLGPADVLLPLNPRLIVARMTGFRRDGKYRDMAGHDINYIAVSGVLGMLGRAGEAPYPPGNLMGDFAGGGAVCFMGILLALMARERPGGRGQIVEANMVDGSAHLASMPRFAMKTPMWDQERGTNPLDGGAPYYGTYETKDGKYMSVGALEPQFFAELLKGLGLKESDLPGDRLNRKTWPELGALFRRLFKAKTRAQWESIFDGTDACVAPVLLQQELEAQGYEQRPIVTLTGTPGRGIKEVEGAGWTTEGLRPGVGGEEVLKEWVGWARGREYDVKGGGLALRDSGKARL